MDNEPMHMITPLGQEENVKFNRVMKLGVAEQQFYSLNVNTVHMQWDCVCKITVFYILCY